MENKIIIASKNLGKIEEFRKLLPSNIKIITMSELGIEDIAETGETFIENALLKAKHVFNLTKQPILADDSGLIIPALNGEPGIFSARYWKTQGLTKPFNLDNFAFNRQIILEKLQSKNLINTLAFFVCNLVYINPKFSEFPIITHGIWQGTIAEHDKGNNGFGYDAIFQIPYINKTVGEISEEKKLTISHRQIAVSKLLSALKEEMP